MDCSKGWIVDMDMDKVYISLTLVVLNAIVRERFSMIMLNDILNE